MEDKHKTYSNPDVQKKADNLKSALDSGAVGKEEYGAQIKILEEDEKNTATHKISSGSAVKTEPPKSSDKILIFGIIFLIVLFAVIFIVFRHNNLANAAPKTIDELHQANIDGKLKPEQGYMYKGVYSFVFVEGSWYVKLQSQSGRKFYNMGFRYSPKEVEKIKIEGSINETLFYNSNSFYATFNPTGEDLSYVTLAIAHFDQHMLYAFDKYPIAACDKNETEACSKIPIVTCESTKELVFYVKESNMTRVTYKGNCILIEGKGFSLVNMTDRVLYDFYGII